MIWIKAAVFNDYNFVTASTYISHGYINQYFTVLNISMDIAAKKFTKKTITYCYKYAICTTVRK